MCVFLFFGLSLFVLIRFNPDFISRTLKREDTLPIIIYNTYTDVLFKTGGYWSSFSSKDKKTSNYYCLKAIHFILN